MKYLITVCFTIVTAASFSQKLDYLKIKDTIYPASCGWRDSLSITEIRPKMLSLDTNELTQKSRYSYFVDLADIEYQLFAYTRDSSMIEQSAIHSAAAASCDPESYGMYWNTAFAYGLLGECDKMKYYLTLYKEKCPARHMKKNEKKQIYYLQQRCK